MANRAHRTASIDFVPTALIPGVVVPAACRSVPIGAIPALHDLVGLDQKSSPEVRGPVYDPPRRIYVTENPDSTFSLLNDPEILRPDLRRTRFSEIRVCVVRFPDQRVEDLLRKHLLYVDTTRRRHSESKFAAMVWAGHLDPVLAPFSEKGRALRCFASASSLLTENQLSKSTFHRRGPPTNETIRPKNQPSRKRRQADKPASRSRRKESRIAPAPAPAPASASSSSSSSSSSSDQYDFFGPGA